jgi:hypothetical protein
MFQLSRRRTGLLTALSLAIAGMTWFAAQPSPAHHPGHDRSAGPRSHGQADDLRRVRAATRRFRDVAVAREAGYAATGECAQDPKYGGMGIHYANPDLVADGKLDITKPEILVYQPMPGGRLRLGAVEYLQADADQDLHTDTDRPYLFGVPFDGGRRLQSLDGPADAALAGRHQLGADPRRRRLLGQQSDGPGVGGLRGDHAIRRTADEDHARGRSRAVGVQAAADLEPGQAGHADVEQRHVGLQRDDAEERLVAVSRLADHLERRMLADQPRHAAAVAGMVVGDEHARLARSGSPSLGHQTIFW